MAGRPARGAAAPGSPAAGPRLVLGPTSRQHAPMNRQTRAPLVTIMPRPFVATLLVALAWPTHAAAQRPAEDYVLVVTGPDGQPVGDARADLFCHPTVELPALRELGVLPPAVAAAVDAGQWHHGTSNGRGVLRLGTRGSAAAGSRAEGLVATADGLGAVVADLQPGPAQPVALQPMAAVTTGSGNEEFTLHARALLPNGQLVRLPPRSGTEVRLPAGTYEAWADTADGWLWQRLVLVSGRRTTLTIEGPAQRLHRATRAAVHPAGRPDIDLFGSREEIALRGAALGAPLATATSGWLAAPLVVPGPPQPMALPWPPSVATEPTSELTFGNAAAPAPSGAVVVLQRGQDQMWRALYAAPLQLAAGRLAAPVPQTVAGDSWLLLVANGMAPRAVPWSERQRLATATTTDADRGQPLLVHARDEAGAPIVDLAVEYTPEAMDPATIAAHSDARGTAHLGPVLGPGTLRLVDARYRNQALPLAAIPAEGVSLVAADGAELRGTVRWPDGSPGQGIVVTVRDPSGTLRPASRSVAAAADGSFVFRGLPEDADLVVFAAAQRDGHTFSGRRSGARAGGQELALAVRDEDPDLDPTRRR